MTTNLTATPSRTSITNDQPPTTPRRGLNKTEICCKESETAHPTAPADPPPPPLTQTLQRSLRIPSIWARTAESRPPP
jgi:hypothetical protein